MKKTLIALATLAAAGGAFAQSSVTLSGSVAFGYEATKTNATAQQAICATTAGVTSIAAAGAACAAGTTTLLAPAAGGNSYKQSGLYTDTASVKLTATEDLGGGMKATGVISAGGLARGNAVGGEDSYIQLEGGFGKVKAGSVELGASYDVSGGAPGPGYGLDKKVYAANVTADSVTWTLPAMGALSFGVSYGDYKEFAAGTAGGGGTTGTILSQPSFGLSAAYADGPVSVSAGYSSYTNLGIATNAAKSKFKVNGTFDLGAVKLGVGYFRAPRELGVTDSAYQVGAAIPAGAVTIGVRYGQAKVYSSSAATATEKDGYSLGATYALSKRTAVDAHYGNWFDGVAGTPRQTGFRVLASHAF